ncbi:MAG: dTDP-4-dehydrorhamnose reductase [Coxiellaceae bacterium]|nr:dTDP-4-dehydrorhamnose reductase [Coxiellaceae bacterium]
MKLLIIGKNGQVGFELVQACLEQGISHVATGRAELDIADPNSIQDFFKTQHDFSCVINAAAYTQVDKAEQETNAADQANHLAVKYLTAECQRYDIALFHVSTDYVFDGNSHTLYKESSDTAPLGVYGKTKWLGEEALRQAWHKHIILRVSWVFGQHGNNFVKTMARLAAQKETLGVVADQYGSPTAARDIARVILQVIPQMDNHWGTYHYSSFPLTTWHQFATAVIDSTPDAITKTINPITSAEFPTATTRPKNSGLDTSKIRTTFGIKQHAWRDYLAEVIAKASKQEVIA